MAVAAVLTIVLATIAGVMWWQSGSTTPTGTPSLQAALPGDPTCPLSTATLTAMGQSPATNSAYHSEFDNSEGAWQGCAIDEVPHSDTGVIVYKVSRGAPSEEPRVRAQPSVTLATAPSAPFSEFVVEPSRYSRTSGYCVQGLLPASDGGRWYVSFSGYGLTRQQVLDETSKIVSTLMM